MSKILEEPAADQHGEARGFVAFARPWGVHYMQEVKDGIITGLLTPEAAVNMADELDGMAREETDEYLRKFLSRSSWLLRGAADRSASGRAIYESEGRGRFGELPE